MSDEEIKKFTIRLKPKTVAWFDKLIGQMRKHGINMSMNEFVAYMAWDLQSYVPKNIEVRDDLSEKEIEELKTKVTKFRKELGEIEE